MSCFYDIYPDQPPLCLADYLNIVILEMFLNNNALEYVRLNSNYM